MFHDIKKVILKFYRKLITSNVDLVLEDIKKTLKKGASSYSKNKFVISLVDSSKEPEAEFKGAVFNEEEMYRLCVEFLKITQNKNLNTFTFIYILPKLYLSYFIFLVLIYNYTLN